MVSTLDNTIFDVRIVRQDFEFGEKADAPLAETFLVDAPRSQTDCYETGNGREVSLSKTSLSLFKSVPVRRT